MVAQRSTLGTIKIAQRRATILACERVKLVFSGEFVDARACQRSSHDVRSEFTRGGSLFLLHCKERHRGYAVLSARQENL